jgi:hypothetical protein
MANKTGTAAISQKPGDSESVAKAPAYLAGDDRHYRKLGLSLTPEPWEDGLRTSGKKGSYEWWYVDAEFHGGTKVVVVFFTKYKFDLKGPAQPTAQIEITLPDGRAIKREVSERKGSLIRASRDKCDCIIRDCYIRDCGEYYEVRYEDEEVVFDCRMHPKMKMWRPATGHWLHGGKEEIYSAWFVALPSADVAATLKIGDESRTLNGYGYHDHNWGNIEMYKVCNHWYWARIVFEGYTIIACDIIATKKYGYARHPIIMIARDGRLIDDNNMITEIIREDTVRHPITKKFVDNVLTFIQRSPDGSVYKIKLKRQSDTICLSLLADLKWPPLAIRLARLVGINPTYTRHAGVAELVVTDVDGAENVISGGAIWEQMSFGANKSARINDFRQTASTG